VGRALDVLYYVMLPLVSKWMLTLAKSVSADTVLPGQSLVYSLTVNNADPYNAATGVTLNDTLPVSTTFVSADGPYSYSNGVVTWLGLVPPQQHRQHLTVAVPSDVPWGSAIVNKDYAISVPPDATRCTVGRSTTVAGAFLDDTDSSSGWLQKVYAAEYMHRLANGEQAIRRYGVNTIAWNGMLYPARPSGRS
jgi:uncharacterized repeat protein (TIGR01451 family)